MSQDDRQQQSELEMNAPDQEKYLQFLIHILQTVIDSQGNPQLIYPLLQQNVQYLNETLGLVLQQWATITFSHVPQEQAFGLAAAIGNLGNAIYQFPLGRRWLNLELGVICYEIVAQIVKQDQQPEMWAAIQNNLANVYSDRIKGKRSENIEAAITAYNLALKVRTREAFPEDWAATQNNLAIAYRDRIKGKRSENIEAAITAYNLALKVRTREAFPEDWAATQNNLGEVYRIRIKGKRAENIEAAIAAYNLALKVRTREAFPEDWAATQNNLAIAYRIRMKGERADNIEKAITIYKESLKVRTYATFPEDWAMTQNNLANAYRNRIKGKQANNIEEAIIAYSSVLKVYNREAFPEDWAMTQNNLAVAYRNRIKGERAENIEAAITACSLALEVYTREAFPEDWAMTQNNLANAYSDRIKGKRSENIEAAITGHNLALEVRTREAFPEDWAMTQNNLANIYKDRIEGERAENIEVAITTYRLALEVYTREAFPIKWATIQNNLANTYSERIKEERWKNIEEAITSYNLAIEVRTHEAFPEDWAMTQNNLANAYKNRIKGEETKNTEAAITAYCHALEVYTVEAFPVRCLISSRSFGNLHFSKEKWSEAISIYELAVKAVEVSRNVAISDRRRQEIIAESIEVFANITQSHIELNQIDQALTYAERSKARNLTELLASRELYPKGDVQPETIEKLKELRSKIPTLDRQLQVIESHHNDINPLTRKAREQISTELKQARTELDAVLDKVKLTDSTFTLTQTIQPITFSEIQDLLDEQTGIIEWYITQDKTFAFIIIKDQTQPILHTVKTETIVSAIKQYLELYDETQRFKNGKENLEKIWITIREALQLDKILEQLEAFNLSKLILIPHRYLHFLPIHALPLADGECLLDKFAAGVSYVPSCQLLQVLERQDKSTGDRFFAIKNPTNNLPFSELEVEAISSYFQDTDILEDNNASKINFCNHPNLEKLSYLHLSCHGVFDFQSPLNSALKLNKTNDGLDNRLTLAEIFELNLPDCRLVTLAACEAGLTDLKSLGDEYIGLPSGFIYAGASAVISSLWPVSDFATSLLMMKLYQNLKQDTQQVAIALNQAQYWLRNLTIQKFEEILLSLESELNQLRAGQKAQVKRLIKQAKARGNKPFSHPYYWAAFTATGI